MTDYVTAIQNVSNPYHREAMRLVDQVNNEATLENGILRWKSNNRVPFEDVLLLAAHVGLAVDVEASKAAREEETSAFLADYRKNYKGPSAEEVAEMRANFEPGTVVVNVITGHRTKI